MWLLANLVSTGMFVMGSGILILILLRRWQRHYGSRRSRRKQATPAWVTTERPTKARRSLTTAPPEVLRWQVEMHELARDLKAELDTKMQALQVLVQQARCEADRLEQLPPPPAAQRDSLDDGSPCPPRTEGGTSVAATGIQPRRSGGSREEPEAD